MTQNKTKTPPLPAVQAAIQPPPQGPECDIMALSKKALQMCCDK
jgi:hypothetical protein